MNEWHLEATLLAEHAEGLLEQGRAEDVEAHLDGCAACRETVARLASVTGRLVTAPQALPMPEGVAARIDQALAAQRANGPAAEPEATVTPIGWLRRRAPQLLAAAAGVAVVGLAGWAVSTGVLGAGDDAESSAGDAPEIAAQDDAADGDEDAAAEAEEAEEPLAVAPDLAEGEAEQRAEGPGTPELESEIRVIVDRETSGPATTTDGDCGAVLADETGLDLIGSAPTDVTGEDAVLVVVEGGLPGWVQGWVLPTCAAGTGEALAQLAVTVE